MNLSPDEFVVKGKIYANYHRNSKLMIQTHIHQHEDTFTRPDKMLLLH